MDAEVCIQIFARAPLAGATKTRLIPSLGAEGAALLHRRLVQHTLRTAEDARIGPVQLWCTPSRTDEFFADCSARYGIALLDQGDGDLGARMERALATALAEFRCAILIGCDCPAFTVDDLREAAGALNSGAQVVMAPAEDGGYTLLGLSRLDRSLFDDIAWGTDQVLAVTRARLRSLNWQWHELRTLWDVDRPEDLERMQREGMLGRICSLHA